MSLISGLEIPKHKLVVIKDSNNNSKCSNLIYDDDLSFKLTSSFGNLWDAHGNNLMTMLSSGSKGKIPSGQFVMQGMQIWQSTDPLSFSLGCKLETVNNAYNDVYVQSMNLAQLCLPYKSKNSKGQTNGMLATLVPPGPNLIKILTEGFEKISDLMAKLNVGEESKGTYNIDVGQHFHFKNVIITSCQPTFSKFVDEDGYPMSADIELEFSTCEIATTDMIADIQQSAQSNG